MIGEFKKRKILLSQKRKKDPFEYDYENATFSRILRD